MRDFLPAADPATPSPDRTWHAPQLRRIGTLRDIAFRNGSGQQGNSTVGNDQRS